MEFKLKDLVNIKYGKNQKNVKNPRGEYPILGTGGIMDYADDFLYDKPSVLIGRKGSIGKVKYIEEPFWTIDTLFYTIVNENLVIPKYLYYKLSQIDFNYYNEGTTIPSLRTETLYKIDIDLPKKNIQKKVVNLLNTIDKKIENNQKIITNLEELSQTLFKHWFVDFEFPDENDNPYKSSGGEMIDSELGEIPERWSLGNFENLGKIVGGGTPSKKVSEYYTKQKEIPWITPKDLSKNKNTYIYHGEQDITELGLNKSSAKLINKDSVLFSSRAPIGYIAIAGQEVTTNQGFKSIEVDKNINPYYVFFLLKYKLPIIEQTASGSTFKEISGKGMKSIPIILPIIETINKYGNIVESYFEKIKVLEKENQKLIQLRNTLLPKLMSGEIEIPDDIEVNKDELSI